jgi:hypothetical protein
MRWMRDLSWRQWLLIIPAVAVLAFGIKYTAKNWSHSQKVASNEDVKGTKKGKRDLASKKEVPSETYSADDSELHDQIQNAIDKIGEEKPAMVEKEGAPTVASAPKEESKDSGSCGSVEIRGDGPTLTKVTPEEWAIVMTQFHGVKKELLTWLNKNKAKFPPKTFELMAKQIESVKMQRPPAPEDPDLAFRGVAVLGKDYEGNPMVRMGNGFMKLLVRNPERGKFELARVAAQSWAPCEVAAKEGGTPWAPLLKCLGVEEPNACGAGSYSEAGWAVSTVLAYKVANPGCAIPALTDASAAACVNEIPFTALNETQWTEARR